MKRLLLLFLLALPLAGCNGSGAVSPLSPANASKVDEADNADSSVIYWSNFPLENPVSDSINAICLINKKNGWACGNNGLVLQYDGETWNKVNVGLGQNENFMSIGFYNEDEGWIGGTHGIILHYNNGQWTQDVSPTTEIIYGMAVTRSRTIWAVGSTGTVLNYNGISWAPVNIGGPSSSTTFTNDIYSISLSDQNNGWAVGNLGFLLKFDGQKWTSAISPTTERLNSVSVLSDVQAWAVGAFGTILNFNGTTWTKMGSAFSGFDLYDIWMKDDSDGWLCGQDGTIAFYDGTRWISHVKPDSKPSLNAMAFYKNIGFMMGQNGTILKFQEGGAPTKYDFDFKGTITEKPARGRPYWTVTYTLLNQSSKATIPIDFILPIPKGFEPYKPKTTSSANGPVMENSTPVIVTATPTVVSTVTATMESKSVPALSVSAPTGNWEMRDGDMDWELGPLAASALKTITVQLASKKKEKKEYPVVLTASLKTTDRTVADALPVTLLAAEPTVEPTAVPNKTPSVSTPEAISTVGGPVAKPTASGN